MMAKTKILYVRLPSDLHRRLKISAAERDRPMSELVVEVWQVIIRLGGKRHQFGPSSEPYLDERQIPSLSQMD